MFLCNVICNILHVYFEVIVHVFNLTKLGTFANEANKMLEFNGMHKIKFPGDPSSGDILRLQFNGILTANEPQAAANLGETMDIETSTSLLKRESQHIKKENNLTKTKTIWKYWFKEIFSLNLKRETQTQKKRKPKTRRDPKETSPHITEKREEFD